jgi:dihydrofolate reductase
MRNERRKYRVVAKLIYSAITSLDGYVADAADNFDWAAPDDEVHAFVNDMERPIGTYLYGRRMYDVMVFWETAAQTLPDASAVAADYTAIWQGADKIVYSTTLSAVSSEKTWLEREFDPEAIRQLKAHAASDISIGGPHLAAAALRAGLVDECHLFLHPVVVGSGNHWLPPDVRMNLELLDQRRFDSGVVHLHYRVEQSRTSHP